MRFVLIPFSLFLLFPADSLAIRSDPGVSGGLEPGRVMRFHPGPQARLLQQQAWQDFLAAEGAGWNARFDQRTGRPFWAWGPPIPLDRAQDATELEASLRSLLRRNPGLLGVPQGNLQLVQAGYLERKGTWYLNFQEYYDGIPVYDGGLRAFVRNGALVLLGLRTHPRIEADISPVLSAETALETAIELGPAPMASHSPLGESLVLLPRVQGSGLAYDLCWEVRTETAKPRGRWVAWVDAHTGILRNLHNEVLFSEGWVQAEHHERHPASDMVVSPIPYANVYNGESSTYTDADGWFDLEGEEFRSELAGLYVDVDNIEGTDGLLSFAGDEATWTEEDATMAEIDSYVFIEQVRDWAHTYAPEVAITTANIHSRVNIDSTCNAYYDGNVNFFLAGGPCNNTGEIADVNYHEWCHGFHWYSLESGVYDSSTSEGVSDCCAFLLTGDSEIAPYFYTTGESLREVETDMVYPDDYSGESHSNGLIVAGAVWDLWQILQASLGESDSYPVISQLFVDAIKYGFTIPEAYQAFLLADDDNGDLGDGTPHQCEIIQAFLPHGLVDGMEGGVLQLYHVPLENQPATGDGYLVQATWENLAPECYTDDQLQGTILYSTDGGETWSSLAMEPEGDLLLGTIPAMDANTIVHYYLEASLTDGMTSKIPGGGSITPFSFYVGELQELYRDDFETDDGGYTHELLVGEDLPGADDWQWGTPLGLGGDPDYAYSGDYVWGNDLGADDYNGEYQNDRHNRLLSPTISIAPYPDLVLQYRRWLTVEDGFYDQALVMAEGGEIWANHATSFAIGDENTEDDRWVLATHAFQDANLDGLLDLSWELVSDGGLTFGGWNIDDVAVLAPDTPLNMLAITDFVASDGEPELLLTWTNPPSQDLELLRVVMRTDRFPESPEDGDQVLQVESTLPDEAMEEALDLELDGYFAIFAKDSSDNWTEGVFQGFNADQGWSQGVAGDTGSGATQEDSGNSQTGDTPATEPGDDSSSDEPGTGCGCSAGPAPLPVLMTGLALLVTATRRRRC